VVERPAKPAKPAVDAQWQAEMREALAAQRQRLLTVVQSTQAQMAQKSGDLADVSDRASEGFEDELDMGLMAIEAAQLDDIEAAIKRIDDGTYGICLTCAKAVPRKRLEVLPFARRCLPCEGDHERRAKNIEASDEEEDWD
jgi:DnaK suppressor protein